jgi:hypothetical protein
MMDSGYIASEAGTQKSLHHIFPFLLSSAFHVFFSPLCSHALRFPLQPAHVRAIAKKGTAKLAIFLSLLIKSRPSK